MAGDFVEVLIDEIDGKIRSATLGISQGNKMYLGGVGGPNGGVGGPIAGVVGQLIQTYVAYDTTEAATITGSGSLVDNLNHIRHDIVTLSGIIDNLELTASGVVTSFRELTDTPSTYSGSANKFPVVNSEEDGLEFITISGITSSGVINADYLSGYTADSFSRKNKYNDDLTSQVPAVSGIYLLEESAITETLRLYINGIRQRSTLYTVSGSYLSISGTLLSQDTLIADYEYIYIAPTGFGESGYGSGGYGE